MTTAVRSAATPRRTRAKATKTIVPDTVERQASSAAAAVKAAEAKRGVAPGQTARDERARRAREEGNRRAAEKAKADAKARAQATIEAAIVAASPPKRPARGSAERKPMQTTESVSIEVAIQNMNLEFIQCRDYGHNWKPRNAAWNSAENYWDQSWRCTNCTTVRRRKLGKYGAILDSDYDYASGYQVKGLGFLHTADRDVIRLASVQAMAQLPGDDS